MKRRNVKGSERKTSERGKNPSFETAVNAGLLVWGNKTLYEKRRTRGVGVIGFVLKLERSEKILGRPRMRARMNRKSQDRDGDTKENGVCVRKLTKDA